MGLQWTDEEQRRWRLMRHVQEDHVHYFEGELYPQDPEELEAWHERYHAKHSPHIHEVAK